MRFKALQLKTVICQDHLSTMMITTQIATLLYDRPTFLPTLSFFSSSADSSASTGQPGTTGIRASRLENLKIITLKYKNTIYFYFNFLKATWTQMKAYFDMKTHQLIFNIISMTIILVRSMHTWCKTDGRRFSAKHLLTHKHRTNYLQNRHLIPL